MFISSLKRQYWGYVLFVLSLIVYDIFAKGFSKPIVLSILVDVFLVLFISFILFCIVFCLTYLGKQVLKIFTKFTV